MSTYDVIIIGTGAGGGTLARHLAPSGKRILAARARRLASRASRRTGAHEPTCSSKTATSSPDTWYDANGQAVFSRRSTTSSEERRSSTGLRSTASAQEDFGELHHHDGDLACVADHLRRDRAHGEMLAQHPLRGSRRPRRIPDGRPPASAPYPFPAGSDEPRIQQLHDDLEAAWLPPVPRSVRDPAERGEHALQRLRALSELRRLPVRGARQVRRRGARRRLALEHPNPRCSPMRGR